MNTFDYNINQTKSIDHKSCQYLKTKLIEYRIHKYDGTYLIDTLEQKCPDYCNYMKLTLDKYKNTNNNNNIWLINAFQEKCQNLTYDVETKQDSLVNKIIISQR